MGYNPCEECPMLQDIAVDHCATCRLDLAEARIHELEEELAVASARPRVTPEDFDQLSELGEKMLASRKRLEEIMERLGKR